MYHQEPSAELNHDVLIFRASAANLRTLQAGELPAEAAEMLSNVTVKSEPYPSGIKVPQQLVIRTRLETRVYVSPQLISIVNGSIVISGLLPSASGTFAGAHEHYLVLSNSSK